MSPAKLILMPALLDGTVEATILAWLKDDGDAVAVGDDLAEIEIDKATIVWQAEAAGYLRQLAHAGDTVSVGTPIGSLHETADAVDANGSSPDEAAVGGPVETPDPPDVSGGAVAVSATAVAASRKVVASPLARRRASELGVDVADVVGSARSGRIVRADVEAFSQRGAGIAAAMPQLAAGTPGDRGIPEVITPSRTQKLIAERMLEVKSTIPEFAIGVEVEFDAALRMRDDLRESLDVPPSVNDLVVKAVALALRAHPKVNASYRNDVFELYPRVNVGFAVGSGERLLVPTVFDADRRSLPELAQQTRTLTSQVRSGTIAPALLDHGTFTVSNLGMFGMARIQPIIHAGQSGILGVGAAIPRIVPDAEGRPVARRIVELTLVGDHRLLNGLEASTFLGAVRDLLLHPMRLMLTAADLAAGSQPSP